MNGKCTQVGSGHKCAGHWTVYREAFTDPEALHGILKGPLTILASHLVSLWISVTLEFSHKYRGKGNDISLVALVMFL